MNDVYQVCKLSTHPLYSCSRCKTLPHDQWLLLLCQMALHKLPKAWPFIKALQLDPAVLLMSTTESYVVTRGDKVTQYQATSKKSRSIDTGP